MDRLDQVVGELDWAVEEAGQHRPEVALLRTHPGVGPVVSLAMVLTLGPVERFPNSRKLVSYLGTERASTPVADISGWERFRNKATR